MPDFAQASNVLTACAAPAIIWPSEAGFSDCTSMDSHSFRLGSASQSSRVRFRTSCSSVWLSASRRALIWLITRELSGSPGCHAGQEDEQRPRIGDQVDGLNIALDRQILEGLRKALAQAVGARRGGEEAEGLEELVAEAAVGIQRIETHAESRHLPVQRRRQIKLCGRKDSASFRPFRELPVARNRCRHALGQRRQPLPGALQTLGAATRRATPSADSILFPRLLRHAVDLIARAPELGRALPALRQRRKLSLKQGSQRHRARHEGPSPLPASLLAANQTSSGARRYAIEPCLDPCHQSLPNHCAALPPRLPGFVVLGMARMMVAPMMAISASV